MKNTWATPKLTVHGTVEVLTHNRAKTLGKDDGVVLDIPDIPAIDGQSIGS